MLQTAPLDIVIHDGLVFDGTGAAGRHADVGVRDGRVATVAPGLPRDGARLIDAAGCWVTPGFLDIHTHYDAEVMAEPALGESIRHGVTTVCLGSCSISMVNADPEDCADLFTRVEALPRDSVLRLLRRTKTWSSAAGYRAWLDRQALGPNVCALVGHSDMRAAVMGLERAADQAPPSPAELDRMERLLGEALDAGFLGLSVMTTRLEKMDGDRVWSRPLPSSYAGWGEFARLFGVLRDRDAVMQGAPNAVTKINLFAFLWQAAGLGRARPLRTTMITAMDLKAHPTMHVGTRVVGFVANRLLRGDFRWQVLSVPFVLYCDGLEMGVFEEFSAGESLRDIRDADARYARPADPGFRKRFRREMRGVLSRGLWHRDLSDAFVVSCADDRLVGQSFAAIGRTRGQDAVDAFFDLVGEHREALRWRTCLGNHRPRVMHKLFRSPHVQIGFTDSGAHVRSLAAYNYALRMLRYVRDAASAGRPFMSVEQAVRRLTGELADWYRLDAGYLRPGDRADIAVVDPAGLDWRLDTVAEAPMQGFGMDRLVNRNDDAMRATIVNGRVAWTRADGLAPTLGRVQGFGRFLSPEPAGAVAARSPLLEAVVKPA